MSSLRPQWPNEFLYLLLGVAALAVLLPWLCPRRLRAIVAVLLTLLATGMWGAYERRLHAIFPPWDPLIRVDLCLLIPAVGLAWIGAFFAAALGGGRRPRRDKDIIAGG